jgi:hypothetical protein
MSAFVLLAAWLIAYLAIRRLARAWAQDWLAVGVLALATVGFFWRVLFAAGWMPAGGGDMAPFLYPNYRFAAASLKRGVIPLWNPYLYGGMPFAADIQSGLFYPPNLALFLLWPEITYRTLEHLAIFHFFLAGVFMYFCLRGLSENGQESLSRPSALAGAVAFMFSDLFVVHFGNLNMIAVAAWLPLVFLLFHRALAGRRISLAAAAGVVLAVSSLAGHIQITMFILLALALYALWRVGLARRESGRWLTCSFPLAHLALAFIVGVGLAALALLPAYEMAAHTPRAALSYEEAARYSLNPAQLVGLLVPGYFGRDPAAYWGPWDRVETGYIGLLPLLLAAVALLLRRDKLTRFFALLALLALLLALGGYGFLHGWLYVLVPGFGQLRAPARFAFLFDFALAYLAAGGLEALLAGPGAEGRARVGRFLRLASGAFSGAVLLAAPLAYFALLINQYKDPTIFRRSAAAAQGVATFALLGGAALGLLWLWRRGWLRGTALGCLAVALIALDLFTLGAGVDVGSADPSSNFQHPAAIDFLKSDANLYRLEVPEAAWHLWQPNTALLYGLYDAWGLYNPLILSDYRRFWEGTGGRDSALYSFLGVKYVISPKGEAPGGEQFVAVFADDPQVDIYLNQGALPRALLLGQAVSAADREAAWAALHEPTFDPASTVVVEDGKPPVAGVRPLDTSPEGAISFQSYDLNEIALAVETKGEAYLVLSEVYYPGWQATVDGQATPLYRANYAFRALRLAPGSHQVRLSFAPLSWRVGVALSAATAIALLAWAAVAWRRRKHLRSNSQKAR